MEMNNKNDIAAAKTLMADCKAAAADLHLAHIRLLFDVRDKGQGPRVLVTSPFVNLAAPHRLDSPADAVAFARQAEANRLAGVQPREQAVKGSPSGCWRR